MDKLKHKILCVEDDHDTCELITYVFNQEGYEVESCGQPEYLKLLREEKFSAIILDNYFIDMSGVEICRKVRSFDRITPIIFFSGEVRAAEINKALSAGANAYLIKPNDFEKLTETVINLIEQPQALR